MMRYNGPAMSQELPKLRPLNIRWITWQGQPVLSLSDPLRFTGGTALVPQAVVPLLALCDGTRDPDALRHGFLLRTGSNILPSQVDEFLQNLDEALLLDSPRFRDVRSKIEEEYRSGPFRKPALAGGGYPEDPDELLADLDGYCHLVESNGRPPGRLTGVVSPHIDYSRGWRTYAQTWKPLKRAVDKAELVIILGTDHSGSPGSLTLTRQSYATPWGTLPTDTALVDRLTRVLGEENAFAEEVHHVGEHSIELAAIWLHYMAGREAKRVLPVLCGSLEPLLESRDGDGSRVWQAIELMAEEARGGATLVVAAGDLSHVGPAFGDPAPLDIAAKARIRMSDEGWLTAACSKGSSGLKDHILQEGDATRICGAAPIHFMVDMLRGGQGTVVAYDQCPADEDFGSLVSVAGVHYSGPHLPAVAPWLASHIPRARLLGVRATAFARTSAGSSPP